jgi:hypothetical protein
MLEEGEAVTNAFRVEEDGIVKVAVLWVLGAPKIEQGFAGVKHKGYTNAKVLAGLDHGKKLIAIVANMVGAIFCPNEVETCMS